MAYLLKRRWVAEQTSGIPRAERRSCEYEAYVPDALSARTFFLDGDVAADVAEAEAAIARLDARSSALTDTEALARILLRAESVASSRIEGLEVGPRRLLRAEAARAIGEDAADVTAEEVLGNIEAMRTAFELSESGEPLRMDHLLAVHRELLGGTRLERHAGRLREVQNWIGGNVYNPCAAAFVPPPPEHVPELLEDLCAFCDSDALPAVAQAAVAHAQFETIHPFVDGNGRVGRALIYVVLRRRGLITRVLPPLSLVLATRADEYIAGLEAFRYVGDPSCGEAHEGLNRWVGTFASACLRAVQDVLAFEERCREIEDAWRARLGKVRAGSSVDLLVRLLPGTPIITVNSAAEMIGRSKPQVNAAVARLAEAGVLSQVTVGKRNRAFEAPDVISAFTDLERRLASSAGDTRAALPVRPVPARRQEPSD